MSAVNELVITPEFVTNIIAVDLADETTFTTADKAKLNGIEAGAQVNTVTRVAGKTGVVELDAGDIAYDPSETYASGKIGAALKSAEEKLYALNAGDIGYDGSTAYDTGTVGKELTDLNRQISDSTTGLDSKAPVIINTASGEIASFADGADGMQIKSLVANIEPIQDLHGQANPYPPGGGKNLLHTTGTNQTRSGVTYTVNSDGTVLVNGTATGTDPYTVGTVDLVGGTAYVISSGATNDSTFYLQAIGDGIVSINTISGAMTFTPPADMTATIRIVVSSGKAVSNITIKPMICLSTATDPTVFAPYSNICPISGWTGVTGQNTANAQQWDEEWEVGAISVSDGSLINVGNYMRSKNYIPVASGKTYYRAGEYMSDGRVFFYRQDKSFICHTPISTVGAFDIPYNACFMKFHKNGASYSNNISINYPSTDTSYHPYTGNQISITFPSEAGTVYGGTLTINPDRAGTLVVDKFLLTSLDAFYRGGANAYGPYFDANISGAAVNPSVICSMLPTKTSGDAWTSSTPCVASRPNLNSIRCYDAALANVNEFKKKYSGIQFVLSLATPITYQLTETEISGILETLYGTNNIWTDVGTVDVEYPADTKLYIEQLTKPTEDDMTANANIAANKFFMIGNTLYFSTAAIAQGATIIPGTNCNVISLADALNNLNS